MTEQALYNKVDWSSFSNPTEAVSTHIRLEWNLDFAKQAISGTVEHTVKVVSAAATQVCFDSANINIIGDVLVDGVATSFSFGEKHRALGTKLSVTIPEHLRTENKTFTVRLQYSIDSSATAVQWLPATATKGGQYPYVFTQSQAIHARSLLPCQDTPGVKTPYRAAVTAPKWCTVLMSALADNDNKTQSAGEDSNIFHWVQPTPTPAYLIALAAGHLSSRDISSRVRIWSEPEVVDAAAFEFSETEDFIQAAEKLTNCPYQWQRYDVLCLPPSFPYGGMENPCLTFATPTLLAGDKSLADVIAHEIAHSWTGNLVTNHTWDHFWLNEGWTVWLERKITSKVKGNDEVGRLSSQIGYKHLKDDIEHMGVDNPFTCAMWTLKGEDPDDAFSAVPYEKGFNLLMYLEELVGRLVFEAFAQAYINEFKFQTVTTGSFRDCFVNFITKAHADTKAHQSGEKKHGKRKNKGKPATSATPPAVVVTDDTLQLVQGIQWTTLFCTPGMPSNVPDYSNSLSEAVVGLAQSWIDRRNQENIPFSEDDVKGWTSQQLQIFLETFANFVLPEGEAYSPRFLMQLDAAYHFSASRNSEIMLRWQSLCLRSNMEYIVPFVKDFITSQGRMKFVRPLYRALATSTVGGKLAMEIFQQHKHIYHPIARKMLETDLNKIAAALVDSDDDEEFKDAAEDEVSAETTPSTEETAAQEVVADKDGNNSGNGVAEADTPVQPLPSHSEEHVSAHEESALQADKQAAPQQAPEEETQAAVPEPAPVHEVAEPVVSSAPEVPESTPTPQPAPELAPTPVNVPASRIAPAATPAPVAEERPAPVSAPVSIPVPAPVTEERPASTPSPVPSPVRAPAPSQPAKPVQDSSLPVDLAPRTAPAPAPASSSNGAASRSQAAPSSTNKRPVLATNETAVAKPFTLSTVLNKAWDFCTPQVGGFLAFGLVGMYIFYRNRK